MLTPLGKHCSQVKEGRALFRKRVWAKVLVLVGLGVMACAVWCLLPGCGSDSKPGVEAAKKKEKTTASVKTGKAQVAIPLVIEEGKASKESGKMAEVNRQRYQNIDLMHGITKEEMDAKNAAANKMAKSPSMEVMPGITQEEMKARNAAANKMAKSPSIEVMPGVTLGEMKARNAAAMKMANSPSMEVMPGVTQEEMKARYATAVKTLQTLGKVEGMSGGTNKTGNAPVKPLVIPEKR